MCCSLQTSTVGNSFCCSKGATQPCCKQSTMYICSTLPPCVEFAPIPDRCWLNVDQYPSGIDHALCMSEATLDDEIDQWSSDGFNQSLTLADNFTVGFLGKGARTTECFRGTWRRRNDSTRPIIHGLKATEWYRFLSRHRRIHDSTILSCPLVFDCCSTRTAHRLASLFDCGRKP